MSVPMPAEAPAPADAPPGLAARVPPWRRVADGSAVAPPPPPAEARRIVGRFLVLSIAAFLVLLAGGMWFDWVAARQNAIDHASTLTEVLAASAVAPHITPGLHAGDPSAVAEFDRAVRPLVLVQDIRHASLRDGRGTLLWTDDWTVPAMQRPLREDERSVLADGESRPRFLDDRGTDAGEGQGLWRERLLETQAPVQGPGGETLLFKTYAAYDSFVSHVGEIWWRSTATTIGVLVVLQLIQVPLLRRMLRRLRRSEEERHRLTRRAVAASDDERRRIAGSLHDGVVQDLAGTSFLLSGALARVQRPPGARGSEQEHRAYRRELTSVLERSAAALQESIGVLRTLLVEIYPANLNRSGLARALSGIARPLQSRGVSVMIDVPDDAQLPPYVQELLFRVGQEALRNVVKHAGATRVDVLLKRTEDSVTFCVADNGIGFDLKTAGETEEGHFGLKVISDVVRDAGATLDIATAPGEGTRIRVTVHLP